MSKTSSEDPELDEYDDIDLDTLAMMLDQDDEGDKKNEDDSRETEDVALGTSNPTDLDKTEREDLRGTEDVSPETSNPTTLTELGLVLSDEEEGNQSSATSKSAPSSFSAAFSGTNLSKKQPLKQQNGIPEGDFDPLEAELKEMEARVRLLQDALAKKKRLSTEQPSKFIKLTTTPSQERRTSTRTLSAREESQLHQSIRQRSELHSGDTDSEDEEDNRNPMEQQYNTFGREIKKRIAHNSSNIKSQSTERVMARMKESATEALGWKKTEGALVSLSRKSVVTTTDADKNVTFDMYSGIRIINPLVSQQTMQERMEGRRMVRLSTITLHLRNGEIEGDWVTIGVLVSKSNPKVSQKGSQYSIWKLSDLSDCTKTAALFLFGGAHKALWKSSIGTVVGILNPNIMKENHGKEKNFSDIISLSLFEAHRVMVMGSSKDLGWCKGMTKQNDRCKSFVNKSSCEFCVYHIQKEYQKTSSKRADLQSSFTRVDPKKRLQERVLGKDQVFYGGQLYTSPSLHSVPKQSQAHRKKDLATLSSLKIKAKVEELKTEDLKGKELVIPKHLSKSEASAVRQVTQRNDLLGEKLIAPTPGARNLLKHMTKMETQKKVEAGAIQSVSAKELIAMTHNEVLARRRQQEQNLKLKSSPSAVSPLCPAAGPQLARGVQPGGEVDLGCFSLPSHSDVNRAKVRAMALIQQKGGIQAAEPNVVKNKKKVSQPEFLDRVLKRLKTSSDEENSSGRKTSELTEAMKPDNPQAHLSTLDINSDKFKEMMEKKSRHNNLIDVVENEAMEKYYQGLEKKEMLEEKLSSVMEITTTAYVCLKCKYMSEKASELCKEEGHQLKTVKAKKRFFECKNCKQRTSSLDKLPRKACSNCEHSSWQRVAMGKVKSGPLLDSEILSLRGDELKHYSGNSNKVYLHI